MQRVERERTKVRETERGGDRWGGPRTWVSVSSREVKFLGGVIRDLSHAGIDSKVLIKGRGCSPEGLDLRLNI